ncbi:MAG TPA: hypothetical protein PLV92_20340 [Pirellulaceae bacterium]|nr:hypothetical protein [Pirellulaceae bacterium]
MSRSAAALLRAFRRLVSTTTLVFAACGAACIVSRPAQAQSFDATPAQGSDPTSARASDPASAQSSPSATPSPLFQPPLRFESASRAGDFGASDLERLPIHSSRDSLQPLAPSQPIGEPLHEPELDKFSDRFTDPYAEDWDPATILNQLGYRGAGHARGSQWLIGNGDRMGLFTLSLADSDRPTANQLKLIPNFDIAIHWFMGPKQTDVPARAYDFLLRWDYRHELNDSLTLDLAFSLGFYSDFEGSARKGLRWPSTAVLEYQVDDCSKWLLGVDILDRDDYFCLPVIGKVWTPTPDVRIDFVFPKPRAAYRTERFGWVFVGMEMWGGTWAVERQSGLNDVLTYRDLRAVVGLQSTTTDRRVWFTDLGIAFDRDLEFRSAQGAFAPSPVFLFQGTLLY